MEDNNIKKEYFASSLQDALLGAAKDLCVDKGDVKYEIITEKTKYFGHKKREIYIRAWVSQGDEYKAVELYLDKVFKAADFDLSYQVEEDEEDDFLRVVFSGNDFKLLLYQNGKLLNSFQYLLNRMFALSLGRKIYCECENFRKKKADELTALAKKYAQQIKKGQKEKEIVIKKLNPFERRIVHMTINSYSELESLSVGDGFEKNLIIKMRDE